MRPARVPLARLRNAARSPTHAYLFVLGVLDVLEHLVSDGAEPVVGGIGEAAQQQTPALTVLLHARGRRRTLGGGIRQVAEGALAVEVAQVAGEQQPEEEVVVLFAPAPVVVRKPIGGERLVLADGHGSRKV